jgi:hypothetical protein
VERALDSLIVQALRPLDAARARWLTLCAPFARDLFRKRALRVALKGALACLLSFTLAALQPLALLTVGPLLLGVPHLVSDARYMVVRQGIHKRRSFWLLVLPCLLLTVAQPRFVWGSLGVALAALTANSKVVRRVAAAAVVLAIGIAAHSFGRRIDLLFAYAHNLFALVMWTCWAREQKRQVWPTLVLYALASIMIFTGAAETLLFRFGSLSPGAFSLEAGRLVRELSPVADPRWALRWLLFFAFSQSVHYAVWLNVLPEEDRARPGIRSFSASYHSLVSELGLFVVVLALILTIAFVAVSSFDLAGARHGYLRLALFHGPLELAIALQLWVERKPIARAL